MKLSEENLKKIIAESLEEVLSNQSDDVNFGVVNENLTEMQSEISKFRDYLIGPDDADGYEGIYGKMNRANMFSSQDDWRAENRVEYAKMILDLGKSLNSILYKIEDAMNEISYLN